jgi:EpsG family
MKYLQTKNIRVLFDSKALKHNASLIIIFFLWPFAAFLLALKSFRTKQSRIIILLFLVLFGLTFIIGSEGLDSFRNAALFKDISNRPFGDFFLIVSKIYVTDKTLDLLLTMIFFVLSRFTNDYHFLFGLFALIFGYVYLKSINLLYQQYKGSRNINALILLAFFSFIIPIFSINGFRFWTASWIFFYGAYHVVVYKDKRYFIVSLLAAMVHFSLLSANLVLFIYIVTGNRNYIYYPLLLLSFISPDLIINSIDKISSVLSLGFQTKIALYNNQDYIERVKQEFEVTRWFIKWHIQLIYFYLYFAITALHLQLKPLIKDERIENLYSFTILFLCFVNFTSGIPSFFRFGIIFFLFGVVYVFMAFLKIRFTKLHFVTMLGLFPMLLYSLVVFRQGSETLNVWLFAPMPLPIISQAISFYELVFK